MKTLLPVSNQFCCSFLYYFYLCYTNRNNTFDLYILPKMWTHCGFLLWHNNAKHWIQMEPKPPAVFCSIASENWGRKSQEGSSAQCSVQNPSLADPHGAVKAAKCYCAHLMIPCSAFWFLCASFHSPAKTQSLISISLYTSSALAAQIAFSALERNNEEEEKVEALWPCKQANKQGGTEADITCLQVIRETCSRWS